jgi:hypothetical protein
MTRTTARRVALMFASVSLFLVAIVLLEQRDAGAASATGSFKVVERRGTADCLETSRTDDRRNAVTVTFDSPVFGPGYYYGPWRVSWCSTATRITTVNWGGKPDHEGSGGVLGGWSFVSQKIVDKNTTGALAKFIKWEGKFCCTSGTYHFPWLRIDIYAGQGYLTNKGCRGCPG